MHPHPSLRERQRDPSRTDPKLKGGASSGELNKKVDHGVDNRFIEHLRRGYVVSRGNMLIEESVVVH